MTQLPVEIVGSFLDQVPVDVVSLARALGLAVSYEDMPDNISGKIECPLRGACKITVNSIHGVRRQRFTIAHEIAHYVLHRDLIGDGIVDNGLYRSNQPSKIERQANQYAADILMPWQSVRRLFSKGQKSAEELAGIFNVSPAVAEIRLKELSLD